MFHIILKSVQRALILTGLSFCVFLLLRFVVREFDLVYVSTKQHRITREAGDELLFEIRYQGGGQVGQTCSQLFSEYKSKTGVTFQKEFVRIEPCFRNVRPPDVEYFEPLNPHFPTIFLMSCKSDNKESMIGIFACKRLSRLFVANVSVKGNEVRLLNGSEIPWFLTFGSSVVYGHRERCLELKEPMDQRLVD